MKAKKCVENPLVKVICDTLKNCVLLSLLGPYEGDALLINALRLVRMLKRSLGGEKDRLIVNHVSIHSRDLRISCGYTCLLVGQ